MTNPNDPKVVPGGDVQFDSGSAPQADSLDTAVAEATPKGSLSWRVENMNFLAEQVWPAVEFTYALPETGSLNYETERRTPPELKGILPYWAFLEPHRINPNIMKFHTKGKIIHPALARPLFDEMYGNDFEDSGLYAAMGFNQNQPLFVSGLRSYFPELERVLNLDGRGNSFLDNPYLIVLSYPIETRPLLTGTLRQINPSVHHNNKTVGFVNVLTTRDILAYARTVGELPRVSEYLELMQKEK